MRRRSSFRTLPGEDPGVLKERLEELIDEARSDFDLPPAEIRVDRRLDRPCLVAPENGALVGSLAKVLDSRQLSSSPRGVGYWTDAALFQQHSGEVVLFGPSGGGFHGVPEWVDVSSVAQTAEVFHRLALDYCRHSSG